MSLLPYDLANELKEAGWPQPERDPHLPGGWISPDGGDHFLDDDAIYFPSISELIEACGMDAQAMLEAFARMWLERKKEGKV